MADPRVPVWGATRLCSLLPQTDGRTPLHAASHAGHVEVVKALLAGGAAVNQAKVCCRVRQAVTSHWVHVTQHRAVEGVGWWRRVWCVCSVTSLGVLAYCCE